MQWLPTEMQAANQTMQEILVKTIEKHVKTAPNQLGVSMLFLVSPQGWAPHGFQATMGSSPPWWFASPHHAPPRRRGRGCGRRQDRGGFFFDQNQIQVAISRQINHFTFFPECVARVPVLLGGLGVRLRSPSFAFAVATVPNRRQPSATARLSTVASTAGVLQKVCQVESCRRSYIGVSRGAVSVSDLCRRNYIGISRGAVSLSDLCRRSLIMFDWRLQRCCLCEWSVSPELYRRLQRSCQREWSVSSQLFWRLQRSCQWEWSLSPQLYWCLQRRSLCRRSYFGVCRGSVSVSDLWRRSCSVVAVLLVFAEKASVRVICGAGCQCLTSVK